RAGRLHRNRSQQGDGFGRVARARPLIDGRRFKRPEDQRFAELKRLAEQFVMGLAAVLVAIKPDVIKVILALELQKPLRRTEPDSPGRRLDAGQNRNQEFLKKIGRREVGTSELGYFFERLVNM